MVRKVKTLKNSKKLRFKRQISATSKAVLLKWDRLNLPTSVASSVCAHMLKYKKMLNVFSRKCFAKPDKNLVVI